MRGAEVNSRCTLGLTGLLLCGLALSSAAAQPQAVGNSASGAVAHQAVTARKATVAERYAMMRVVKSDWPGRAYNYGGSVARAGGVTWGYAGVGDQGQALGYLFRKSGSRWTLVTRDWRACGSASNPPGRVVAAKMCAIEKQSRAGDRITLG